MTPAYLVPQEQLSSHRYLAARYYFTQRSATIPLGCCRNKYLVILFATVGFNTECKNKYFRHILLFYFRKGKKAAEAHKGICEVYGVNCLTERTCQNLFEKFRSGDFSLKDDQRSGRPSDVDDVMKAIIESNCARDYKLCERLQNS